jgi:uncharacterized protein
VSARAPGAPFLFNVAGLLGEPPGSRRDYRVSGATVPLDDELELAGPIEGDVRLDRTNRGLLVTADLTTSLVAECSRCLRSIEVPVRISMREEALPIVEFTTGAPVGSDDEAEPDTIRLTDHHELDLEPAVRAEISLQEPIAPLCRPDCPGLCPECGERLETGDHGHADDDIDPRLAALRGFQAENDGEE